MFKFHIIQHVPGFILRDKNGYALARAIEAALEYLNSRAKSGYETVRDVDSMPEWRLDEMAWELNCLYEYNASIEQKRKWIREARPLYRIWGTKESLQEYLDGYFDNVEVEENWVYGGDPYHFRIFVEGTWNPATEAWTINAVNKAKNVRSILDDIAIGCNSQIGLTAEGYYKKFPYPLTSQYKAGEKPVENIKVVIDEDNDLAIRDDTIFQHFPYELSGTSPEVNVVGAVDDSSNLGIRDDTLSLRFPYDLAGTSPDVNTVGILADNNIQSALADDFYMTIQYRMCGQDEF